MKLSTCMITGLAALAVVACGSSPEKKTALTKGKINEELRLKGDKTVYGLACEGCTDSVMVVLPSDGSDPVRYDIIDAHRAHKIMGKPKVGDWVGLVLNEKDKTVADMVIDLDELKGIWCYVVMPKMRDYDKMSRRLQQRIMRNMPDSMKETYLIPREYGFWIKRHWIAQSVGYVNKQTSLEDESPVVYPQLAYFTAWHIWNGKLVLTSGTPVGDKKANSIAATNLVNDTCNIDYLYNDSLVLSSDGSSRSYYRKNDVNDVNKKARAIAGMLAKKALQETTK